MPREGEKGNLILHVIIEISTFGDCFNSTEDGVNAQQWNNSRRDGTWAHEAFPRLKAYVEGLLAACAGGVLSEKNYAHVIGQTQVKN